MVITGYTQCKLLFECEDSTKQVVDTVWIPAKLAVSGKAIILDRPVKRRAVILEVYHNSTREKVDRRKWGESLPTSVYDEVRWD